MADINNMKQNGGLFVTEILTNKFEALSKVEEEFERLETIKQVLQKDLYEEVMDSYLTLNEHIMKIKEIIELFLNFHKSNSSEDAENLSYALKGIICKDIDWDVSFENICVVTNRNSPIYFTVYFEFNSYEKYGISFPIVKNFSGYQDFVSSRYAKLCITRHSDYEFEKVIFSTYCLYSISKYIRDLYRKEEKCL